MAMDYDRRGFLRLGGIAAVGALAGCSGTGSQGSTETTGTATETSGTTTEATTDETTTTDDGSGGQTEYGWEAATWDSYWYSLFNMSTNIAMSANGVLFPHNKKQRKQFKKRIKGIKKNADVDKPPINNPNLNMAAFTEGDPHFTQKPVFSDNTGRPNADTLTWDKSKSSKVVSPSSLAWTHLKGVTWAKNFEAHFDILPEDIAPKFRSQVLTSLAQIGINATLIKGGPDKNGALTASGDSLKLVSGFKPSEGKVVDETPRVHHHSAMLWFLSDMVSLAQGGWFGYENPKPLIPAKKIQQLADGMFKTTMSQFPAGQIENTRDIGQVLGAVGWYGTHAGSDKAKSQAVTYANALGEQINSNLAGNGKVENGTTNQAATQGIVGQGLLWASELDGVNYQGTAEDVLGYMTDTLWDADAGTFASGNDASTYTITARDAGDITGGLNAADAVLNMSGTKETFATFFNQTFNRGKLQRAQRPVSVDEGAEYSLPLPQDAGGEYGQAAVYNAEVEYDTNADSWSVTDDTFKTEWALYLANQDIWVGQWAGDFYQGRGRPGHSDTPPQ